MLQVFPQDGELVLDLELELVAPLNQLGDLQFLSDAGEAPTLGPEGDKPLLFLGIIHEPDNSRCGLAGELGNSQGAGRALIEIGSTCLEV